MKNFFESQAITEGVALLISLLGFSIPLAEVSLQSGTGLVACESSSE